MKDKTKRKEIIIIGVLLLLMIVIIVGTSWAAFNYSRVGTQLNSITTGSITMTYTETDNTISLSGALPTTDKTGTVKLTPGEYSVVIVVDIRMLENTMSQKHCLET